jgi:phage nucleotide-binding protein
MGNLDITKLGLQEVSEKSGYFMLLFGKAGVGKSSLASKLGKKVLFLDCEGTASLIEGIYRIPVTEYKEVVKYKRDFLTSDYDTLVIDGLRSFEVMVENHVCEVMGRTEYSPQQAKYGDIYTKKRLILGKFIESTIGRGKKIIIIAHVDEVEKVDTATDESFLMNEVYIKDKELKNELPAKADIVAYLDVEVKEGKALRRFDVLPNKSKICKNRFGITKVITGESPKAIQGELDKKIKEFYNKK